MERVAIWYLTDNEDGEKVAVTIKKLGLKTNLLSGKDFKKANVLPDEINIFIIDLQDMDLSGIMSIIRNDPRLENFLKFLILHKKQIKEASNTSINYLHIEYISRKVKPKEFSLLLEKSIIVERYREMMKYISREAEERIEAYESLMDINRKDIFESNKEKEAFMKIITYEKHLMEEQEKLNRAIKEFTLIRQKEMFDLQSRIKAEEMLGDLRRKELIDANSVVRAQEALIDYSTEELKDAKKMIHATEQVQELSRTEAMRLHDELKKFKDDNLRLKEENKILKNELDKLRKVK